MKALGHDVQVLDSNIKKLCNQILDTMAYAIIYWLQDYPLKKDQYPNYKVFTMRKGYFDSVFKKPGSTNIWLGVRFEMRQLLRSQRLHGKLYNIWLL